MKEVGIKQKYMNTILPPPYWIAVMLPWQNIFIFFSKLEDKLSLELLTKFCIIMPQSNFQDK